MLGGDKCGPAVLLSHLHGGQPLNGALLKAGVCVWEILSSLNRMKALSTSTIQQTKMAGTPLSHLVSAVRSVRKSPGARDGSLTSSAVLGAAPAVVALFPSGVMAVWRCCRSVCICVVCGVL